MIPLDRQVSGLAGAIRAQFPEALFMRHYPGNVVAQRGANSFDFQPDDAAMPGMSAIPMKLPHPGLSFTLSGQTRAVVVFADASPSQPEIHLWEFPALATWEVQAAQQAKISAPTVDVDASSINLGADLAIHPMILGDLFLAGLATLLTAIQTALTGAGSALTSAGGQTSFALAKPFLVTAGGDLTTAVAAFTAFDALVTTFPSTIVKASG